MNVSKNTPQNDVTALLQASKPSRCVRIMYQEWLLPYGCRTWALQVVSGGGQVGTFSRIAFGRMADRHDRIFVSGTSDCSEMVELGASPVDFFGYWLIVPGTSPGQATDHWEVRRVVKWLFDIENAKKAKGGGA